ncbi:MAG TPA: hypothetical protein PK303_06380 [bacterium]|nr:hypothetical protein [bacterium]
MRKKKASQNKYGMSFFDLTGEQQEDILNTTTPDYEGTGEPPYGSITPNSTTDENGIATSIYTAGTEPGYIEICAKDTNIKISERGSWLMKELEAAEKNKEKLKLRIWLDPYGSPVYPIEVKNSLQNIFCFLSIRLEFINQQFQPRSQNDRYVYNSYWQGMIPEETGRYNPSAPYEIYVSYAKIEEFYERGDYGSQESQYSKRIAYTIAHEIEHTYQPWWIGTGHHNNCIMIPNITALPDGENWQDFCNICKRRIKNAIGD